MHQGRHSSGRGVGVIQSRPQVTRTPTIVHLDAFGLVGPSVVEEPVGGEVLAVGIGLARHVTHLEGPLVHRGHLVIAQLLACLGRIHTRLVEDLHHPTQPSDKSLCSARPQDLSRSLTPQHGPQTHLISHPVPHSAHHLRSTKTWTAASVGPPSAPACRWLPSSSVPSPDRGAAP